MLTKDKKPTVCFDFDGVIHSYTSGWKGDNVIPDPPVDGIKEVIDKLRADGYEVVICSSRCERTEAKVAMLYWLINNGIHVDKFTAEKPPAVCYVDDRAIRFDGKTEGLYEQIKNFESYLQKGDTNDRTRKSRGSVKR